MPTKSVLMTALMNQKCTHNLGRSKSQRSRDVLIYFRRRCIQSLNMLHVNLELFGSSLSKSIIFAYVNITVVHDIVG